MLQSLGRVLQQPQPLAAFQRQSAAHSKLAIASCERPDAVAAPARRVLLASLAAAAGSLLLQSPAAALNLRSQQSQVPSIITFSNELDTPVKIYWINYSGDAEFYANIPPAGWWAVDSFESHPWRVVDARTGAVLQEIVSAPGESLVRIDATSAGATRLQPGSEHAQPSQAAGPQFEGWDGIGGRSDEYVEAVINEIGLDHLGGVVLLDAEGYALPVPVPVGMSDAAQLFHTAGPEFRRPSTLALWVHSLQAAGASVDRVLITRLVGTTVYARVILGLAGGQQSSLDARPADALSLAIQSNSPIYISRRLAASQQPGSPEFEVDWQEQAPPRPRRQDSPLAPLVQDPNYSNRA